MSPSPTTKHADGRAPTAQGHGSLGGQGLRKPPSLVLPCVTLGIKAQKSGKLWEGCLVAPPGPHRTRRSCSVLGSPGSHSESKHRRAQSTCPASARPQWVSRGPVRSLPAPGTAARRQDRDRRGGILVLEPHTLRQEQALMPLSKPPLLGHTLGHTRER